ncbi:hypothetical protein M0812_04530 [Anaeramoeba flamelloides]|uniref:Uncharacterized protein n=1 Tax=Anaeramoeba flamelloides TaxID=1746091 RepID=A0AAV8AKS4_9EUKA|nr:hypothetical protein M0812_04530 [Anaeramoeba flamelloides]
MPSTDIFHIEIQKVEGKTVTAHVKVIYQNQVIPVKPNFAFQILLELFQKCSKGYIWNSFGENYEFDSNEGKKMAETHPMKETYERMNGFIYGRRINITKEEYQLIKSGQSNERISTYGFSESQYYKMSPSNEQSYIDEAQELIESVTLENASWTKSGYPEGDLVLTVSDSNLLHHVRTGSSWPSTIYDMN